MTLMTGDTDTVALLKIIEIFSLIKQGFVILTDQQNIALPK
jgi:hypothetical protein